MAIQTFTAAVSRVADLTHDVREIELELIDPPEISFKAGQFISFEVQKKGFPQPVTRPYSIASPPSEHARLTLVLNLVAEGPGSTYLFSLREGDRTTFKGPAGTFYLREDAGKDRLLIATGTGIAPFRSMILSLLEKDAEQRLTLFWGLRSQRDLYYQDALTSLAGRHPQFAAVTTLSRPEPGWTGATGRVTELVDKRIASVKDLAVYLCGNGGMIRDVTELLRAKGLCPIYREKYYD